MYPSHIVTHHSTTPVGTEFVTFEQIKRYHMSIGYSDIGYHRVVDDSGVSYIGRPENTMGAHCRHGGFNHKSLGICLLGNFQMAHPYEVQRQRALWICVGWVEKYKIPVQNVLGHNETGALTLCPGIYLDMDRFREDLRNLLNLRKYYV